MTTIAERPIEPVLRIRAPGGWRLPSGRELWGARELLFALGRRTITVRYRQTVLGVMWVVLGPLLSAGIFSFLFGRVAKLPSDGVPYFVFSYAGLLAWNAYSTTITTGSSSTLSNSGLISKVYFPRLVLPLSTLFATLVNFAVALAVMIVLLLTSGVGISVEFLLVPAWLALVLLQAMAIAIVLSGAVVWYRDITYLSTLFVSLVMYLSPVAYAAKAVPDNLATIYHLNPLVAPLEGFRRAVLGRGDVDLFWVGYSVVVTCVLFIGGLLVFNKIEPKFSDVI